ncbi:MAG: class E sortase [Candidatus Saccharimonadales bacterium]|nr:class E sortase [Candidatus Saccharimonadales bacterium]
MPENESGAHKAEILRKFKAVTTLRRFNNGLSVVVVGLGLYLVILPFLPSLQLWIDKWFDDTSGYRYQSELAAQNNINSSDLAAPPTENTLIIPSIQVDEKVVEGSSLDVIGGGGVWRRPGTSTPDQGGNTVIVGHRFSYSDPSTFYHLDKMNQGERFAVFWNSQEYIYEVFEEKVVPATAIEIEDESPTPIMTLYTCTPVWTARDRLVIKARLVEAPDGFSGESSI